MKRSLTFRFVLFSLPKVLDLYIHLFTSRNFALWKEKEVPVDIFTGLADESPNMYRINTHFFRSPLGDFMAEGERSRLRKDTIPRRQGCGLAGSQGTDDGVDYCATQGQCQLKL